MALNVLEGHFLLQAFSSVIFRICGASRRPLASAVLIVRRPTDIILYTSYAKMLTRSLENDNDSRRLIVVSAT